MHGFKISTYIIVDAVCKYFVNVFRLGISLSQSDDERNFRTLSFLLCKFIFVNSLFFSMVCITGYGPDWMIS